MVWSDYTFVHDCTPLFYTPSCRRFTCTPARGTAYCTILAHANAQIGTESRDVDSSLYLPAVSPAPPLILLGAPKLYRTPTPSTLFLP